MRNRNRRHGRGVSSFLGAATFGMMLMGLAALTISPAAAQCPGAATGLSGGTVPVSTMGPGCYRLDGNLTVANGPAITVAEGLVLGEKKGLKPDRYGLVKVKGRRKGDFSEIILPDGLTGLWVGNTYCVVVEKK